MTTQHAVERVKAELHTAETWRREPFCTSADLRTILAALERAAEALKRAEGFIVNGVDFGFIRLPESMDDPAHLTLPAIQSALQSLKGADHG